MSRRRAAARYGTGSQALPLLGGDHQRRAAELALPRLRWRLEDHRHVERSWLGTF